MKLVEMLIKKHLLATFVSLSLLLFAGAVVAQDRWVTDQGEFTMRSGKSTSNKIVRMLKSGMRVELLQTDAERGYSLVRIPGGPEGWVVSRFLLSSPPALVRLPQLEKDISRVAELSDAKQALQIEVRQLATENKNLAAELDRIKRVSASAVKLDRENSTLRSSLSAARSEISELEDDNRKLGSKSNREWFVVGAVVLVFGVLMGLIIPRLKVRKKSSW
ncbi:MAG: TIGR04211 family SH3 domain-containing protein [Gammaproteobacteria bacterium]|nr:TIGR04211 family SH3 domain-containing protein [Gammaproteobacteria bacterium]